MTDKAVYLRLSDETARVQLERLIADAPGWTLQINSEGPYDLLVFEITQERAEEDFHALGEILAGDRPAHVCLVSHLFDPNLLVRALRVGAKEFFTLPLKTDEVRDALLRFQSSNGSDVARMSDQKEREGVVVHVMGSKGGVGTTTLAVNLAAALLRSGKAPTVALVDMNLLFGDIPIFLGMQSYNFDWSEVTGNIARLDRSFLSGTLYKHRTGLQVLPSPKSIAKVFNAEPDVITRLFKVMKKMFDYTIVDGGQGLDEMSKAILRLADKVLIATLLNLPCLVNVKRLRETFDQLGYPLDSRVQIVANRVHRRSGGIGIEDAERTLRKAISWVTPNDFQDTMDAINQGKTLYEIASTSEISRKIMEMAEYLLSERDQEMKRGGLFGRANLK